MDDDLDESFQERMRIKLVEKIKAGDRVGALSHELLVAIADDYGKFLLKHLGEPGEVTDSSFNFDIFCAVCNVSAGLMLTLLKTYAELSTMPDDAFSGVADEAAHYFSSALHNGRANDLRDNPRT